MVINLIIAAIIDGLASAYNDQNRLINKDIIDKFIEIWTTKYDPKFTWELDMDQYSVWLFLAELPDPMHESKESTMKEEWNPNEQKDTRNYIYKYDEHADEYFKVKKITMLKFLNKMDIKFFKRQNGKMYVKFDDIAEAWITKHITMESMIEKMVAESD